MRWTGLGMALLSLLSPSLAAPAIAADATSFDRRVEFAKLVPDFRKRQSALYEQLQALVKEVEKRELNGIDAVCPHQVLRETEWLIGYTTDYPRIESRLAEARRLLASPDIASEDAQSPEDGAWGRCASEWFFKLDASYDRFAYDAHEGRSPAVVPHFLDRINSPEGLTQYFMTLLVSDIATSGVDHRRELNEAVADVMRLILRDWPANYHWHPTLKATLRELLLEKMRDPATGYWGAWFQTSDGLLKTTDLSLTFHIVSYLEGEVPDWPRLIDTTLAIKDERYPRGWRSSNGYENHHNMDVVELMRLGWAQASAEQRARMVPEIEKMLAWCLKESLQPDGSFKLSSEDESVETSYYFGASFLVRTGYFDKALRFWTDRDFSEAPDMRDKIVRNIKEHLAAGGAEGGFYYRNALEQLGAETP
ncbi:MAG: hypothetical protein JO255_18860 [Alphaproteobacteria bacterium]|nr:hypothetical protein [Alphaproteobacteria bacterium]